MQGISSLPCLFHVSFVRVRAPLPSYVRSVWLVPKDPAPVIISPFASYQLYLRQTNAGDIVRRVARCEMTRLGANGARRGMHNLTHLGGIQVKSFQSSVKYFQRSLMSTIQTTFTMDPPMKCQKNCSIHLAAVLQLTRGNGVYYHLKGKLGPATCTA